ncbi:polyketide synthase [Apiospora marii]|uniref:Polyketide synthase n=1 Tax=Apiospora marii TaxID=335849 RepID=A0ABR1RC11_9PEZI
MSDSSASVDSEGSPTTSDATSKCPSAESRGPASPRPVQTPVAVVGMACRLPGHSSSPTALWDLLERGGIAKHEPPPSRFSLAGHYDRANPGRPRTMKSPGGMFVEDVDPAVFDGQFFNLSRVECIAMDPQQRQMLEVAYECLENAGVPMETLSGTSTGVVVGTNFIDYAAMQHRDPEDAPESVTIGVETALLSNRVSHFLNVHGPSMTIDTACSAGLVSLDVACRYLDTFQADAMLVGGVNLWLTPEHNEEVGMMHVTQSGSGQCKSFDASADGYVKAEGVNCVLIKRLDNAVRDHDPIRSIIRGTAVNASGRTGGIANPSQEAQAAVTRQAYQNAGLDDFTKTQYLECHGTGTLAGDPIEVNGAGSVFSTGRDPGQDLIIGSIKSNIGHSEPAAGLSGLLKATLAMEKGVIPGTPSFLVPNPNIDWKNLRVKASRIPLPWPSTGATAVRRASVNSFGFGGANAHAVLENDAQFLSRQVSSYKRLVWDFLADDQDEDDPSRDPSADLPPTVLAFSANDPKSLTGYVKSLNAHLQNPAVSIDVADLAYTLSERRSRHYNRAFALVRSSSETINPNTLVQGKPTSSPPHIAFVFTGQGAQWPSMGAELIKFFPSAKAVIDDLDGVLQSLPDGPPWTLLEELTAARSAETLRRPEFSQPLGTALQLALLRVLEEWGIRPEAVVGHSSGEIAAAVAAGLITPADAIKTAYYRGQASKKAPAPPEPLGMLAVGVGAEVIDEYLGPQEAEIRIACFNSPKSLTMSGSVAALERLRDRLREDGHFARMLQVDMAYHSDYMTDIGDIYEDMLLGDASRSNKSGRSPQPNGVRMYSSVTGNIILPDEVNVGYWKRNMVSPVNFAQATSQLLTHSAADFLIELGPSNALSGPISQIQQSLGKEGQYAAAMKREADSILSLFEAAGPLFLAGDPRVDMARVNRVDPRSARVVIDLPNYAWNHSTRYWHETRASRDWRFKEFIHHDLLGSKISATGWRAPVFKSVLKLANLPWLRDHKLGGDVVFPASGYVAMAVEAMYQTAMITQWKKRPPVRYRFRLRDVRLLRALVLTEDKDARVTLALTPLDGASGRAWYNYEICSVQEGVDVNNVHSTGQVCVETHYQNISRKVAPLELATRSRIWYKVLAEMGYNYGPAFQKHLMIESTMGQRKSRSTINLEPPPSQPKGQSPYPMHPAVMDGCFQAATPCLWNGHLPKSEDPALVPKTIESIVIESGRPRASHPPVQGVAVASAHFIGAGSPGSARNYSTNVDLYDPEDGALLFHMKGLASTEMDTGGAERKPHEIMRVAWRADIDMLMQAEANFARSWLGSQTAHQVIDLVAHKTPALRVLEMNLSPGDGAHLWTSQGGADLDPAVNGRHVRAGCAEYHFAVRDAKTLVHAQESLSSYVPSPNFHLLLDLAKPASFPPPSSIDLAILSSAQEQEAVGIDAAIQEVGNVMKDGGFIVACGIAEGTLSRLGQTVALAGDACICQVNKGIDAGNETPLASVVQASFVDHAAQSSDLEQMHGLLRALQSKEWSIQRSHNPLLDPISKDTIVVVLDELFASVIDRLDDQQWALLKYLTQVQCPILWVTSRSADPTRAAVVGLFSTIRAEEQIPLFTLDVEGGAGDAATVEAISACLEKLRDRATAITTASERGGVIQTSRVYPDSELTAQQSDGPGAGKMATKSLHACESLVQLRCERLGSLDSVQFSEVDEDPMSLPEGMLKVDIHAAGLNHKDAAVAMGILPGDETALGSEAAGVISKVCARGSGFSVGDRVVLYGKGCCANRVQTTPARVHRIPDSITFEEAATLPMDYLVAIHALLDLGSLSTGKTVLIHRAAGGVGIAAIQLAQHVGSETFVTVSTAEERESIKATSGLGDDHIFDSSSADIGERTLEATHGKGIDVVLTPLAEDLLEESFPTLAEGAIVVALDGRDALEQSKLPMTLFQRHCSFRLVDLSPETVSDDLISRLLARLFELIDSGAIKSIIPIHRFSWNDIPAALRFLRKGTHIGKVVVAQDAAESSSEVQVKKAPESLGLRPEGCYLIVGGLRGICGTLATYLAQKGARHLAIMSRSGYTDVKSRYVLKQLHALGSHVDLLTADVTHAEQVRMAMQQTTAPIVGIIQGAMVLRDRPFESMTLAEYHDAIRCKIRGTWNLHHAAASLGLPLDSFTLLSSLSGLMGNVGQANYAAANVFLDAFAAWRRARGQPACSVALGISEDTGVIAESAKLQGSLDSRMYRGLGQGQLGKVLRSALLQQKQKQRDPHQSGTLPGGDLEHSPIVTGLVLPQPEDSILKKDARFSPLFAGHHGGSNDGVAANTSGKSSADVQALLLLLRTESAQHAVKLHAMVDVVGGCFMRVLRLSEPMDSGRPISVYGTDSLAAVEVRNWIRTELGALVTTLDIMSATSLTAFCEKILGKLVS